MFDYLTFQIYSQNWERESVITGAFQLPSKNLPFSKSSFQIALFKKRSKSKCPPKKMPSANCPPPIALWQLPSVPIALCQLPFADCPLPNALCQLLSANESAFGKGQLANGNWQRAIGRGQLAKGNWQRAIDKGQLANTNTVTNDHVSTQLTIGTSEHSFKSVYEGR